MLEPSLRYKKKHLHFWTQYWKVQQKPTIKMKPAYTKDVSSIQAISIS